MSAAAPRPHPLRRAWIVLAIAALAFMAVFAAIGSTLGVPGGALGGIAKALAQSPEHAQELIARWKSDGHDLAARAFVWLDFPFIAVYVSFLVVWALRLQRSNAAPGARRLATTAAATLAAIAAVAGGAFDVVEDTGMLRAFGLVDAGDAITPVTTQWIAVGTQGKALAFVALVILIALALANRRAARGK